MAADAVALTCFVGIGTASHGGLALAGSGAVTLACMLACWFAAAAAFAAHRRGGPVRTVATWAVAVPAAVALRALLLGRPLDSGEAAFLATSLIFSALFVLTARLVAARISRPRRGAPLSAGDGQQQVEA